MKKKFIILFGSCLIVFCSINNSMAEILTWQLTGEVEITGTDIQHVFPIGAPVTYTFTIDTDTLDSNPCDTTLGEYFDAVVSSEVVVENSTGNYIATVDNAELIADISSDQGFHVVGLDGSSTFAEVNGSDVIGQDPFQTVHRFVGVYGTFKDNDQTMLTSDDLHIFIKNIISDAELITFALLFSSDDFGDQVHVNNLELIDVSCGTTDVDGDTFYDLCDNCPETYNPEQTDSDGDLKGDDCDRYPDDSNNEARYEEDLLRAQNELAQKIAELRLAQSELGICQIALDQCASNYAQCSGELSQCSDSLTKCEAYLTQSEANYNQCIADLTTCETDLNLCLNPPEPEGPGRTCFDGLDNDSNGLTDCADPACAKKKGCR